MIITRIKQKDWSAMLRQHLVNEIEKESSIQNGKLGFRDNEILKKRMVRECILRLTSPSSGGV